MRCTVGIDFGTESARAVLVDCGDGRELGATVEPYEHGVIDARLPSPDSDVELGPDWALQDPADYIASVQGARAAAARGDRRLAGRGRRHRRRLHVVHDAAHARRRDAALHAGCSEARAARLGEAVEAPRRAAGGGSDQRASPRSAARRGSRATAGRSRRSGSSRRRCRSSTRRRRSTLAPTG